MNDLEDLKKKDDKAEDFVLLFFNRKTRPGCSQNIFPLLLTHWSFKAEFSVSLLCITPLVTFLPTALFHNCCELLDG